MPVAPVFEFTTSDPLFANGEKILSVASPFGSAAGRMTFRLARWFDFDGGAYTIKAVADDAAFFYASVDSLNPRAVFSTQLGQGVVQSTVYLPRGRRRMDIVLSNLTTGASPCYVIFSLWKDGNLVYASNGAGWVFDTALIPDSALPDIGDPRRSLRVFSVLPNWAGGVTERIEYLSEVLPSEADEEQRISTRRFPRRSIEASFARHDLTRARLDAFLTGAGRDEVLVPLWHEQYVLPATLGATLTFPSGSLAMREFFAGDLVIAMNKEAGDYEVLTVETANLSTDTITFEGAPVRTWAAGCRVIPLRVAQMLEPASMQGLTDNAATAQIRFFLKDHLKWPSPSWGGCSAIFRFPVNRATPLTLSFDRATHTIDNEIGRVDVTDASFQTRVGTRLSLILRGRSNVFKFRQFIAQARGRTTRFWMPTLSSDLIAEDNFSSDSFDVKKIGLVDCVRSAQDARSTVAIKFNNGRATVYRRVLGVIEAGTSERVFVTPNIPPISQSEVESINFVVPSRFDQDGFELQHPVDDSAVVQVGLVTRSSGVEGMPPLECVTTSRPYPIVDENEMRVEAEFLKGALRDAPGAVEAMRSAAEFVAGTLGAPFAAFEIPEEAVASSAEFVGGAMDENSVSYSIPSEAFGIEAEFIQGVLDTLVIQYEGDEEMLEATAQFIEGTLT